MAGELVPEEGSMESADAGIYIQQENASRMPDTKIQAVQVATEVSMKHTRMTTLLVESQGAMVAIENSLSRDKAQKDPDQLDPWSLSSDDRSAEILDSCFDINDLVIGLGASHLGSASVALGGCSSMEMMCTRAGIPDKYVSATAREETTLVTETISKVPRVTIPVQGNPIILVPERLPQTMVRSAIPVTWQRRLKKKHRLRRTI